MQGRKLHLFDAVLLQTAARVLRLLRASVKQNGRCWESDYCRLDQSQCFVHSYTNSVGSKWTNLAQNIYNVHAPLLFLASRIQYIGHQALYVMKQRVSELELFQLMATNNELKCTYDL
jgi:hypothetical protein